MPTRLKFTLSRLPSLFVGNSKYWTLSIFVKTDGSPQLIGLQKKNALTDKSFQYVMTFSFTIIPFLYLNIFMPPRSYGILSLLFPSMWTALKSKHLKQSSRTFDDVSSTKLLVVSYCVYTSWFRVTDSLYPNILSAACLMTWAPRLISSFVSWILTVALILRKKRIKIPPLTNTSTSGKLFDYLMNPK